MVAGGIGPDRRANAERRSAERRRAAVPVTFERRSGADRRRRLDRREAPGGHIRHAIQLLEPLVGHGALPVDDREDVKVALRRLWCALGDIERPAPSGSSRSPNP
jgi:hypothetical protein